MYEQEKEIQKLNAELQKTKNMLDIAVGALEEIRVTGKAYVCIIALNKLKKHQK